MDRQIFISYVWEDKPVVKVFHRELLKYNVNVWIDEAKLRLGEHVFGKIGGAIYDTSCFIIFLSRKAYRCLETGTRGFNLEIERIMAVRDARKREGKDTQIVLILLDRFTDLQLVKIPLLQALSATLRIHAFTLRHQTSLQLPQSVRTKVREFISKGMGNLLVGFPRVECISPRGGYILSVIAHGQDDDIEALRLKNQTGGPDMQLIPMVRSAAIPTLKLKFKHHTRRASRGCWWAASLAFGFELRQDNWKAVDLSHFSGISFEARFENASRKLRAENAPLLLRFEDDSLDAAGDSYHQSTSWNCKEIRLTKHFRTYTLSLEGDFSWNRSAWPMNTSKVNRRRILQLTFGHDHTVPDRTGVIEIRQITFLRTING